jgi:hypothetical protein
MDKTICLTTQGLRYVSLSHYSHDFRFIVDGRDHWCPSLLAQFLSPRIARQCFVDASVSSFELSVSDPLSNFAAVLAVGAGVPLRVNRNNHLFFAELAQEFENAELYLLVEEAFNRDITVDNVYDRYKFRKGMNLSYTSELEFFSAHFYELPEAVIALFTYDELYDLLSGSSLKLITEDSLYQYLSRRCETEPVFFNLLEFVHFEFLSVESISHFIRVSGDFFDQMNASIWASVCSRLACAVDSDSDRCRNHSGRYLRPGIEVPFSPSVPLDGIVAHLTKKCGGNVHDYDVVTVTESGMVSLAYPGKNTVDLGSPSCFQSPNLANQWICYDFKNMRIKPTHYSVCSYSSKANSHHLKSWALETSEDGSRWVEVDRREDNYDLNGSNVTKTFQVRRGENCRFVRLRQTGKNHCGFDIMMLSGFELFGTLEE